MVKSRERFNSHPARVASNGGTSTKGDRSACLSQDYFSMFCYAWDVLDEGTASFAQLSKQLGLTNISIAASYHGGKALLPHNKQQHVYFIEEGAVYFPAAHRYFKNTRLKPRVSRLAADRDIFRDIVERCGKTGVSTTAWTVALHNTHLGLTYPDVTTQNVFGDHYFHSLCPSQPDVIAYMRALAGTLASYPIEAVEFETFEFVPFRHYAFLEKEGIGVTPFAGLLLSLCFCPACLSAAKRLGVNARLIAKAVKVWLQEYFQGKNRRHGQVEAQLSSIDGLAEYLDVRFNVLAHGFREIADLLHAENKRVISLVIGQEQRRDHLTGIDLERVASDADAIETLFYKRLPQEASGVIQAIRKAAGKDTSVYLAVRPGYPDARDANDVMQMTKSILKAGGNGISYYNFGLLEKHHLDWIRKATGNTGHPNKGPSDMAAAGTGRLKPETEKTFVRANVLRQAF
jgi:hypothetical protein